MQRELRKIGEEYRRANTEGFASIVRSMEEINQGLRGIASEMTEYSKRSIGRALEIQAQLARMAFGPYDALIARAEALNDTSLPVAVLTETSKRQRPRAVAQSASVATKRKSGVVKRQTQSKKAKSKRR
jgi:hypothetical protein